MIRDEKLDFWLMNGFNVLFVGKHGVGKTATINACFTRNGLVLGETFLYFSAATLDPWVDLVGVPKERAGDDGIPYLDLVRPRPLAAGTVRALFFDEFNRSHKKTRNAVMELLQFKSINGKPFPNLRVVWAAVNPDDGRYDVEPLDPAQMDRFHVTIVVPYKPSLTWFSQRFGERVAKGAVAWWEELPDEEKEKVSPRRLEYALRMDEAGGDIRDVLPASSNVTRLHEMLRSGPASERAEALFQARDVDAARLFLAHENNLTASIRHVTGSDARMGFFLPLVQKERLAALMSEQDQVCSFVCRHRALPGLRPGDAGHPHRQPEPWPCQEDQEGLRRW